MTKRQIVILTIALLIALAGAVFYAPHPGTVLGASSPQTFDSSNMTSSQITLIQGSPIYAFRLANITPVGTATGNANRKFGQIQNVGAAPAYCVMNTVATAPYLTYTATSTFATASITVGPLITSTSSASGIVTSTINGFLVQSASVAAGATSSIAASALAVAINASSSVLGLSASTSSNVINMTANLPNVGSNIIISITSPQNVLTYVASTTAAVETVTSTASYATLSPSSYGFMLPASTTVNSIWNAQTTGGNIYAGQVWCTAGTSTTNLVIEEAN